MNQEVISWNVYYKRIREKQHSPAIAIKFFVVGKYVTAKNTATEGKLAYPNDRSANEERIQ